MCENLGRPRPFRSPCIAPIRLSPHALQAKHGGGAHTDMHASPPEPGSTGHHRSLNSTTTRKNPRRTDPKVHRLVARVTSRCASVTERECFPHRSLAAT